MWFGTSDGLDKFDGYTFTHYKYDPDDSNSLSDNDIYALYEDRRGALWIGTNGGLNKYDPVTGIFSRYLHDSEIPNSISNNGVRSIAEDRDGNLWIGTVLGLNRFDQATGSFTRFRHNPNDPTTLSHDCVGVLYRDSRGVLWIGTGEYYQGGGGLNRLHSDGRTFVQYRHDPKDARSLNDDWVTAVSGDESGLLWVGTNAGLEEFDEESGTFTHHRLEPRVAARNRLFVKSVCEDASGVVWAGTWESGLYRCVKSGGEYTVYRNDPLDPESIGSNNVMSIYEDRSRGIWLATSGGGVCRFEPHQRAIAHFKLRDPGGVGPALNDVWSIWEAPSGNVWIGTFWGIHEVKREDQHTRSFLNGPPDGAEYVYALSGVRSRLLWIGTAQGLFLFNEGTGEVIRRYDLEGLPLESPARNGIYALLIDDAGKLWIGTMRSGLLMLDPQSASITRYVHNPQDEKSLSHNSVFTIIEDKNRNLWVGTFDGLNMLDRRTETFVRYYHDPSNSRSLASSQINALLEDDAGVLWVGTNRGMSKCDRITGTFTHITERDGLTGNVIQGILPDSHGNLWISTHKGLCKFNPLLGSFRKYDVGDGLQGSHFNRGACFKNQKGEMFFGGSNGFNVLFPDSVKDNPNIPPIVITDVRLYNEKGSISLESPIHESLSTSSVLQLSHDQNTLSFEFAALDYRAPEKNQYAYKLDGTDRDWVFTGNRRYANYSNLPPGSYAFRVKGSNNDGIWNEQGTSISIIISPPWWKTTWAYLLYSIIVLSVLYGTWKMQVKRIRRRHEYEMSKFEAAKLHDVDELKSRFFANISHEFRTPLTLILGPVRQIIEQTKEEETRDNLTLVHRNANRLLGLVNQLLDLSKLESGHMKLQTVPQNVVPLLKTLVLSFVPYAERKRITLSCASGDQDIRAYIDKDKIEKILTNILSNAFKFTPEGGNVAVVLAREDNSVKVSVSDTGVGIPADKITRIFNRFYQVDGSYTREQEGTGIGLSLTKELVELHKGTIEVESEEGRGTTFVIRIPLGKEHLKPDEICEPEKGEEKIGDAVGSLSSVTGAIMYQEESEAEKPAIGVIADTEKPLLLIVEDNPDVRSYIHKNVGKDYRVLEAVDGEDGWNKSIEWMPDVIVSDVMMGKMDGFRLCEKLKTDERTSHIPVILLTAKASTQDRIEGYATGADDYIMKPFEPEEVNARIANLIEQRKRLHEHFRKHGLFEIEETKITPVDQRFLQNVVAVVTEHMSDPAFGVESLAAELAVSRSVLLRKIEALIGELPNELIKRIRLNKAAILIESKFGNVTEIALEVGFSNPSYFAECFKRQFGCPPSHYHRSPANQ